MNLQPARTMMSAAVGGFFASSIGPIPDLAFITQIGGVGALCRTLAVLRSDALRRRRGLPVDVNRRWSIVARWTVVFAGIGIVADIGLRVPGAA
jgi:hypothetical protein